MTPGKSASTAATYTPAMVEPRETELAPPAVAAGATGEPGKSAPRVTLIIAMRNEAADIERCINSVAAQDYPADRLEVLIYDGASTDRSREIASHLVAGRAGWSVIDNPRRIQAVAWNLGIVRATGDVIGILSGHAELGTDYVTNAVETLERTGATMVGGPVRAIGGGRIGEAVALATSSPFGVGGARFHYLRAEEVVDTVFMGLCTAEDYRRFPFDEEMVRDQDDELSYRILDAGGSIVCNPAIQSGYRPRATFRSLWLQYFDYGFWKVRVIQKHPRQARPRQVVPAAFVAASLGCLVLAPIVAPARTGLVAVLGSYVTANLLATVVTVRRADASLFPHVALSYAVVHAAYGVGLLGGLLRFAGSWPPGTLRIVGRSLVRNAWG
jgi:succinoglycan biosynthesis protein ExoA